MADYEQRTHVDLFSGIGGFTLAAHANGIRTIQFVEIDQRCRNFLAAAWPGVAIHDDIKTFHWSMAESDKTGRNTREFAAEDKRYGNTAESTIGAGVFLLTAGVPCQPASRAGKQRGAADDRWLWPDAIRVFCEVQPAWAIFENPPGIGDVGLAGILSDVESKGYEVRVFSIPACAVGAPHGRERYYIVCRRVADAAPRQNDRRGNGDVAEAERRGESGDTADRVAGEGMANSESIGDERAGELPGEIGRNAIAIRGIKVGMGNAEVGGRRPGLCEDRARQVAGGISKPVLADASQWRRFVWLPCADGKVRRAPDNTFGLVDGLHRSVLAALGNSIVPQVAEILIKVIMETEYEMSLA
jgi:DNA (cytosine-5)-methyltransferase 1